MSIIHPDKISDFKVTEGSLDCEWVEYINGYGDKQKLFKVNPQSSKVVSLNKAGIILPDTGYSFMESITVTNTAPVGENNVGVIYSSVSNMHGILESSDLLGNWYSHPIIFVKDGKVATKLVIGETYQNLLYPTDSWKVHEASWAIGRRAEDGSSGTYTTNAATCLEKNNSGRVSLWVPEVDGGDIIIPTSVYTYKSFNA